MKLKREEATRLVDNALTQAYDEASFRQLVQNLCPDAEMLNEPVKTLIPDSFQGSVTAYKRLAKYEDPEGYTLDVLAVKLSSQRTLENARTLQRNFVARYLNGSRGGQLKDAALVAFYADDCEDWRFSLVRMDYELNAEKQKVEKTLTPARRFSFLVGKGEKTHTARQQLLPILETSTAITLKEIEAAFNIEKVTKEFFEEYKKLYLRLKEALDQHLEKDAHTEGEFTGKGIKTEDFAKRLLGQLVFLYFLQKKGWLGVAKGAAWGTGSKNYLKELFDTENLKPNRNFFNDVLEHLFYDALATERQTQDHFFPALNCKIPFLNGGLFEPFKGYAWDATDILLDNAIFKAIFDVFDLYNFTVREDEPLDKEVAVDPEMLGNVFERLMSEEERGKSGAFYTPKPVVHYMSQQSLINYLDMAINTVERPINDTQPKQTALFELPKAKQASLTMRVYEERIPRSDLAVLVQAGESAIEHERRIAEKGSETDAYQHKMPFSIRQHKQALDDLLKQVRVLDPAIGSGAFPVGMMIEIVRTRRLLAAMMKRDVNAYDLKWDCIEHSLYGVDKNASAVDIAKLRLWLSLVVDEESFDDIKPLPNLDYKIREGDSLIGFTVNTSQSHQALTEKLLPLKHQFFAETRPARKKALRAEIDSLLAEKYEASRRIEGAAITFDPHLEFSEVFTSPNSGFDVVIANPPYVRHEEIKELKAGLSVRYKNVAKGTADLLVYFYELAHKLLREEGCLTFISSNKFMRAGYGDKLRGFLSQQSRLRQLIDFGDLPVFQGVAAYPLIVIANKQRPQSQIPHTVQTLTPTTVDCLQDLDAYIETNAHRIPASQLGSSEWQFAADGGSLQAKIAAKSTSLKTVVDDKIYRGVLTGFNKAFVIDEATRTRLIAEDPKAAEVIKPYLEGKDVKAYSIQDSKRYLILIPAGWTNSVRNSAQPEAFFQEQHPSIYQHLKQAALTFSERTDKGKKDAKKKGLYDRTDQGDYWWELRPCKYYSEFNHPKIIYPNILKKPAFTLDENCYHSNQKTFIIPVNAPDLVAYLNSSISNYLFWQFLPRLRGDFFEPSYSVFQNFPIPNLNDGQKAQLAEWAQRLLDLHKEPDTPIRAANIAELERNINQLLYAFYDLTPDEIATIEGC